MAHVDLSRIQETSDGDLEFERELIEMYIEDAALHLQHVAEQLDAGDFPGFKVTIHTLKGSSANIGATGLQQLAVNLEKSLSANAFDPAKAQEQLANLFEETKNELMAYLDQIAGS